MKKRFAKYTVLSLIAVVFAVAVFMTAATSVNRVIEEAVDFSQVLPDDGTIGLDVYIDGIKAEAGNGEVTITSYTSATYGGFNGNDEDSKSKWWGSSSCSSYTEARYYIKFSGNVLTAIKNGRMSATVYIYGDSASGGGGDSGSGGVNYRNYSVSGGLSGSGTFGANYSGGIRVASGKINASNPTITIFQQTAAWGNAGSKAFRTTRCWSRAHFNTKNVRVELSFTKPTVTFKSSNTSMGTVSTASATPDFYNTASSTASAKDGFYFSGWSTGLKSPTLTTTQAYNIGSNPTYTASFDEIDFPVGTYVYNGKPQAPAVTGLPGEYSATYSYQGTRFNGVSYGESTTKPTDAGNYTATATIKNPSGVAVGTKTVSFTIERADLTATLEGTALYGQILSQAAFDPAGNVVIRHASDASLGLSYINGAGLQGGTVATYNIEWTDGSIRLPYGTSEQTFRVVLNDVQSSGTWYYYANNYNNNLVMTGGATIATANGLTLSKLEGDETDHPQNLVAFDYDAAYTFVKDNIAYIGLRATPDEAGAFYFAGWRTGNVYFTLQKVYSYPLPADYQEEAIDFQGVFIGVTTEDVRRPYDGSSVFVLPAFTYSRPSTFGIVYDDPVYSSGTYPVAIGEYTASIAIYNNSDGNNRMGRKNRFQYQRSECGGRKHCQISVQHRRRSDLVRRPESGRKYRAFRQPRMCAVLPCTHGARCQPHDALPVCRSACRLRARCVRSRNGRTCGRKTFRAVQLQDRHRDAFDRQHYIRRCRNDLVQPQYHRYVHTDVRRQRRRHRIQPQR